MQYFLYQGLPFWTLFWSLLWPDSAVWGLEATQAWATRAGATRAFDATAAWSFDAVTAWSVDAAAALLVGVSSAWWLAGAAVWLLDEVASWLFATSLFPGAGSTLFERIPFFDLSFELVSTFESSVAGDSLSCKSSGRSVDLATDEEIEVDWLSWPWSGFDADVFGEGAVVVLEASVVEV